VTEYARGLPGVAHAENNLYTCSQDSIHHISEQIKNLNLNRVVVASCTPLTHQPLFEDCLRSAADPYLFEMANIRNQCSWVHSNDREAATPESKRAHPYGRGKVDLAGTQHTIDVTIQHQALVIGGGAGGMVAAINLAGQGFPSTWWNEQNSWVAICAKFTYPCHRI